MAIRLYKENGEILNIQQQDIEKYVGKHAGAIHNNRLKRAGIQIVVDNNALKHNKGFNEHASKELERFTNCPVGVYGDAVVITLNSPGRAARPRKVGPGA